MPEKSPHIACLMMLKNEQKRLPVTLKSLIGQINSLVIYDTGSTDNTIDILEAFSKEHNIPLRLKRGEFVNFCESRNVSLDFADSFEDIDFLLLLDCNDELKGGEKLREIATEEWHKPTTGFLVCQQWWSGQHDKYYNMRFVRARGGWRYFGAVHEYMKDTNSPTDGPSVPVYKLPDEIYLYQDRTQDDDKTGKRFARDKVLLYNDYLKDRTEPRTLFYLAQTCSCLGQHEEAYYYYKLRGEVEGFGEEKFHAFLRCGKLSETLGHPWEVAMSWYLKALNHSDRAEPYVMIGKHYIDKKKWLPAYTFLVTACRLNYPYDAILFVDKRAYDYTRWHLLGIASYYAGILPEGREACKLAIKTDINKDVDERNLKFYDKLAEERFRGILPLTFPFIGLGVNKENKIIKIPEEMIEKTELVSEFVVDCSENYPTIPPLHTPIGDDIDKINEKDDTQKKLTKKEFIDEEMRRMSKDFKNLSEKARLKRAQMLWKLRNKK